jgi:phytanoyl-CoA hydroxylase
MSLEQALEGKYSFFSDPKAALANYHEYGFHVEKDLLDPAYCDLLIAKSYDLPGAKVKDFKPFMMPHREDDVYLAALKETRTVAVINQLVEGEAAGLQSQFFYCRGGTRGFSLHQDNFFVQAKEGVFASAWIALVDTTPTNGGLIVYPGSHKQGLYPVSKLALGVDPNQDPNANNEESQVPKEYPRCDITLPKGGVVFIHGHIVHGSNSNQSDQNRYVLLNTYIRTGETFRSGNYAQREQTVLA